MENRMSGSRLATGFGDALDWRQLLVNWSFPCPSCRQVGILRTDREFHYQCRHCGETFDIREPSTRASPGA